jgi:hypothetical protein
MARINGAVCAGDYSPMSVYPNYLHKGAMQLAIFHQQTKQVFRGIRGKKSPFEHMFGGSADYAGLTPYQRQPPVHLLFRLNTADPAVGVTLRKTQWLPLLCAIRYGACNLGYRVTSDKKVKILYQEYDAPWDDFPYDGYPTKLPAKPVALQAAYDPQDLKDVFYYAAAIGYETVSAKQYAQLVRRVEKHFRLKPGSGDDYLQKSCEPFVQGEPKDKCPDPACQNHRSKGKLRTLAIFEEELKKEAEFWGPSCENLQIIWQLCPKCAAIRTTNQCT